MMNNELERVQKKRDNGLLFQICLEELRITMEDFSQFYGPKF
jgi:hypothetical protein